MNKLVLYSITSLSIISLGLSLYTLRIETNTNENIQPRQTKQEGGIQSLLQGYQAVFLTNGQVYFGQVKDYDEKYLILNDIYYLQNPDDAKNLGGGNLTLVKLGDELHGPKDQMIIRKDHMMFLENLKEDGKVLKQIKELKSTITK